MKLILLLILLSPNIIRAQFNQSASCEKNFYGGTFGIGASKLWYPTLYTNLKAESKFTKTLGFEVFIGRNIFKKIEVKTKFKFQQFNLFTQYSEFDKQTLASTIKLNNYLTISNFFIIEQSVRWTTKNIFTELGIGLGYHLKSKVRENKNGFDNLNDSPFITSNFPFFYSIGVGYIVLNKSDFKISTGINFSPPLNHEIQAFRFRIQIQKHF